MAEELNIAQRQLEHGRMYPYDGGNEAAPTADWAHAAARGVLADLLDRRGVKWELEKVDHDVRVDIITALAAIIRGAAPAGGAAAAEDDREWYVIGGRRAGRTYLAELARDAERYRWMRNADWFKAGLAKTEGQASAFHYGGELLDKLVDAGRGVGAPSAGGGR